MPLYRYIQDLKMNKAVELLNAKKSTLPPSAEAVGYKYAQHISTTFKKNYGVTSRKYNKMHL